MSPLELSGEGRLSRILVLEGPAFQPGSSGFVVNRAHLPPCFPCFRPSLWAGGRTTFSSRVARRVPHAAPSKTARWRENSDTVWVFRRAPGIRSKLLLLECSLNTGLEGGIFTTFYYVILFHKLLEDSVLCRVKHGKASVDSSLPGFRVSVERLSSPHGLAWDAQALTARGPALRNAGGEAGVGQ